MAHLRSAIKFIYHGRWLALWLGLYSVLIAVGCYAFHIEQRTPAFFGAVSPDGQKVAIHSGMDWGIVDLEKRTISHWFSAAERDVTNFPNTYYDYHPAIWAGDNELAWLKSDRLFYLQLLPDGKSKVTQEQTRADAIYRDAEGMLIGMQTRIKKSGKSISFVRDFDSHTLFRIEIGLEENAELINSHLTEGRLLLFLRVWPYQAENELKGDPNYKITNSQESQYLILDGRDGRILHEFTETQGRFWPMNSADYVAKWDAQTFQVVKTSDITQSVFTSSNRNHSAPAMLDSNLILLQDPQTRRAYLRDIKSSQDIQLPTKIAKSLVWKPVNEHTLLASNANGQLLSYDLNSKRTTYLGTIRPYYVSSFRLACWGLPIALFLWPLVSRLTDRSILGSTLLGGTLPHGTLLGSRFLQVFFGSVSALLATTVWFRYAGGTGVSQAVLYQLALFFFLLAYAWSIIAGSNARQLLSRGLPAAAVAIGGLLIMRRWSLVTFGSDNVFAFELSVCCGLFLALTPVALISRIRCGPLDSRVPIESGYRFSLSHAAVAIVGISVLLAVARYLNLRLVSHTQTAEVVTVAYFAAAVVWTYICAVHIQYPFRTLFFLAGTLSLLIGFEAVAYFNQWQVFGYGTNVFSAVTCLRVLAQPEQRPLLLAFTVSAKAVLLAAALFIAIRYASIGSHPSLKSEGVATVGSSGV